MISRPCSAARRLYFSVSRTWPGGGSSRRGAGWPISLWKTSSPAGIAICSRWHSVSKRSRCGMSFGSQMKPPGSMLVDSSPHVHVTLPSSRYQPSSSLWWTCSGVCPAGVLKSSKPSAPPVLSPLALIVIRICRYQIGSPPSESRAKNSFDITPSFLFMRGRHLRAAKGGREVRRELLERARVVPSNVLEVVRYEIAPPLGIHAAVVHHIPDEPPREAESEHRLLGCVLRQCNVVDGFAQDAAQRLGRLRHVDRLRTGRVVDLARVPVRVLDDLGREDADVAAVHRPEAALA